MRRFLLLVAMAASVLTAVAQRDVTKFLGIPVDGTKAEMRRKLIAKGFTPTKLPGCDFLEGEFNGEKVQVFVATNNNRVCRICLCDERLRDEANIRIRFNNLLTQFDNNSRYLSFGNNLIPEDENISYGMTVKNKVYEACFYQAPQWERGDTLAFQQHVREELLKVYTEQELGNPTDEIAKGIASRSFELTKEVIVKKSVWFRICAVNGQYSIAMYYDNEYNRANGEDL